VRKNNQKFQLVLQRQIRDKEADSKKRKVSKLKPLEVTKSKVIHHRTKRHQEAYKTDAKYH